MSAIAMRTKEDVRQSLEPIDELPVVAEVRTDRRAAGDDWERIAVVTLGGGIERVPPSVCRAKATATTAEGRTCEAHGSAHIDRDDDKTLLLEMADTRARKRALSVATGTGAVAVEELRSEVDR